MWLRTHAMEDRGNWGETLIAGGMVLRGRWLKEVYRANPEGGWYAPSEVEYVKNVVTNCGMNYLASRISCRAVGVNSDMSATAIGTVSTAATLSDTAITGEVDKKLFDSTSLNLNVWVIVNTWAGNADSVTSYIIAEAGVFNSLTSGTGVMFQRVTFSTVTLADSDYLKLQIETTVGSR